MFLAFCCEREYKLNEYRSLEKLSLILKDCVVNIRKNGTKFKEATVKTMRNSSCKLLQEKYYKNYNIIDSFDNIVLKLARDASDAMRKNVDAFPCKHKSSSDSLNLSEVNKTILIWMKILLTVLCVNFAILFLLNNRGGEEKQLLVWGIFFQIEN